MVPIRTMIVVALVSMLSAYALAQSSQFTVFFGTGSDHLGKKAHAVVAQAAAAAREQRGSRLVVAGYGDGETAADAALGDRRAMAVARALIKAGIEQSRIDRRPGAPQAAGAGMPVHKVTVTLESP